ncbi:uncharacterized protein V1510DRAFT_402853 [Dipodascopsis tothii]|uniref:uncharacterized protein n=1 Tax=Dipodascopsis tothii TaxID=44089 RepID=UPI0034CDCA9A
MDPPPALSGFDRLPAELVAAVLEHAAHDTPGRRRLAELGAVCVLFRRTVERWLLDSARVVTPLALERANAVAWTSPAMRRHLAHLTLDFCGRPWRDAAAGRFARDRGVRALLGRCRRLRRLRLVFPTTESRGFVAAVAAARVRSPAGCRLECLRGDLAGPRGLPALAAAFDRLTSVSLVDTDLTGFAAGGGPLLPHVRTLELARVALDAAGARALAAAVPALAVLSARSVPHAFALCNALAPGTLRRLLLRNCAAAGAVLAPAVWAGLAVLDVEACHALMAPFLSAAPARLPGLRYVHISDGLAVPDAACLADLVDALPAFAARLDATAAADLVLDAPGPTTAAVRAFSPGADVPAPGTVRVHVSLAPVAVDLRRPDFAPFGRDPYVPLMRSSAADGRTRVSMLAPGLRDLLFLRIMGGP